MHIFQKYQNLGIDLSEYLYNTLQDLHVIGIVGVHNSGKKTTVYKLKRYYDKTIMVCEQIKLKYQMYESESKLCNHKFLLYTYLNKKNISDILNILQQTNPNVHLIILGNSSVCTNISSYCYVHRCKCPSYDEKLKELTNVSILEYSHTKNVETICNKYTTYHDCLIALEMYENDITDIFSYEKNAREVIHNYVFSDKLTKLQTRTVLYNLMMHLTRVSDVMKYMLSLVIEKVPNQRHKLTEITSKCEYEYAIGNKEIYHYEHLLNMYKDVYLKEKKSK
jgi:hypothetical protein